MPTNDFLPWATGGGANVESQPDYLADTVRPVGYANGDSPPADQFNKALRQASSIASAVAAFIVAQTGLDVLDAGDIAALAVLLQASVRIRLIANTTFYVNEATGNDANSGLVVGTPWATIQHAINVIKNNYDLNGFQATIQLADGTYNATNSITGEFVGGVSANSVIINGNAVTPTNVALTSNGNTLGVSNGARVTLQNLSLASTSVAAGQSVLSTSGGGEIDIGAGVHFLASGCTHCLASGAGTISFIADYHIDGGGVNHVWAQAAGLINMDAGFTATLTGAPAFTGPFAFSFNGGLIISNITFNGAATGTRYSATFNGVINTAAAGANYFPGNVAGSTASGGQYG